MKLPGSKSGRPRLPPAPKPEPLSAPKRWYQRIGFRLGIVLLVAVLFLGWKAGTFDRALVNVGLNAKPCARNGFGAMFCGQELEERQAEQRQAQRESQAAELKVNEEEAAAKRQEEAAQRKASKELAAMTRKGEEAQVELQREGERAQRESNEELAALKRQDEQTEAKVQRESEEGPAVE